MTLESQYVKKTLKKLMVTLFTKLIHPQKCAESFIFSVDEGRAKRSKTTPAYVTGTNYIVSNSAAKFTFFNSAMRNFVFFPFFYALLIHFLNAFSFLLKKNSSKPG